MRIWFPIFYGCGGLATNLLFHSPLDFQHWATWAVMILWPAIIAGLFLLFVLLGAFVLFFVIWLWGLYARIPAVARRREARVRARVDAFIRSVRTSRTA